MRDRPFLDTNILIYAVGHAAPRSDRATELLRGGGRVSAHVLNEFASVARRKLLFSWPEIRGAVDDIVALCPDPVAVTLELHRAAAVASERYGYHIYDGLVIAAALAAGCGTLWSEDMQHGQVIDGRLTIRNPFRAD